MSAPVPVRDDRLLPETRWVGVAIVTILVPAFIVLWGFPGDTVDLWAWTIQPDMSAILFGAAYAGGAFFFFHGVRGGIWHPMAAGVLAAAVFAALMLVATLIHWDRFNHGDADVIAAVAFFIWTAGYILAPLGVFALWLRNRATDPRRSDSAEVAVTVRRVAGALGLVGIVAGIVFFASPSTAIDVWPWQLTELTARVLAAFIAEVGVAALLLSIDARWSAWRLTVETFVVVAALVLVGVGRVWDDFDHDDPATWVFVGGLVVALLSLAELRHRMDAVSGGDLA
jgi:peptidoglycan/LPS O-acetylase OafA/YrhL